MVIRGARVIDGTGAPARVVDVVIRGGKIEAFGSDAVPPSARVIDAAGQTLLPGLFDLHTHLSASAATGIAGDWGKSLKAYLACGVTTVNDYATYGEMFAPLRQLLASGTTPGPRVNMAVRMSSPAGHGTEAGWGDAMTLIAATPAQAHQQTQIALSFHPDAIKVFTDGWRYGTAPNLMSMNLETLAAIVEDAHAAHVKVFTHTVTLGGAKIAARAGVDVLVHGIGDADVDDELIGIMKAKGTVYVSTLAVYEFKGANAPAPRMLALLEPEVKATVRPGAAEAPAAQKARWQHLLGNVKKLYDAGVPVAVGTDAGMPGTFHGYATLRELELMVQAGMTPMQALTAATSVSARALGVAEERGTIAVGKAADLVLVQGRPEERIADLYQTQRVFRGGTEFTPANLEKAIQSSEMTALPVHQIAPVVDDIEVKAGRTELGTLRLNATDAGVDHSAMIFLPVIRGGEDHALLVAAQFAGKERPFVRADFPLTPGAIDLADVSMFSGVMFDVRGEAAARLLVQTYHVRGSDTWAAPIAITGEWQTVKIPYAQLKRRAGGTWDGKDARALLFEISGAAGTAAWMELDNVRFY